MGVRWTSQVPAAALGRRVRTHRDHAELPRAAGSLVLVGQADRRPPASWSRHLGGGLRCDRDRDRTRPDVQANGEGCAGRLLCLGWCNLDHRRGPRGRVHQPGLTVDGRAWSLLSLRRRGSTGVAGRDGEPERRRGGLVSHRQGSLGNRGRSQCVGSPMVRRSDLVALADQPGRELGSNPAHEHEFGRASLVFPLPVIGRQRL